jgi:hypothetical protein
MVAAWFSCEHGLLILEVLLGCFGKATISTAHAFSFFDMRIIIFLDARLGVQKDKLWKFFLLVSI